jgi:ribosomal protein L11 methyltransferase
MLVWRKLTAAKWEDAWLERLGFLDPSRIAIFTLPNAKTIRIEAYDLSRTDARRLTERFGGQVRELKARDIIVENAKPRPPLLIRDRLVIVRSEKDKAKYARKFPKRRVLVVPAAMAFGTGDHATTATCLRMLCDFCDARPRDSWEMLDLGTGTGILALAARVLGTRRADAFDFDPDAVRAARENIAANKMDGVRVAKLDVTKWTPKRQWDVVAANLYSQVLIRAAAQITRALKPGGALILSGILREQEHECAQAFSEQGVRFDRAIRRGKWVTLGAKG